MKRAPAILLFLFIAATGAGQTVTAIAAKPANARTSVVLSYGQLMKMSVRTGTSAQAAELSSVQIRLFRGTVQEKLDKGANPGLGIKCFYYDTLLLRPAVSRVGPTDTVLDFKRTIGSQWAADGGMPFTQRYTLVFEKVANFEIVAGGIIRRTFAIEPATHNDYFASAVDMIIDPGRLTPEVIQAARDQGTLAIPVKCPAAIIDRRQIQVADIRPVAVPPPPGLIAAVRRRLGMSEYSMR